MFLSSANRVRAWFAVVDDFLGDPPADAHLDLEPWVTHPHRRPLQWKRARRGGSVPPAPAHCLCPVRATPDFDGRSEVMR